jgi:hypothetical protein
MLLLVVWEDECGMRTTDLSHPAQALLLELFVGRSKRLGINLPFQCFPFRLAHISLRVIVLLGLRSHRNVF